LEVLTVIEVEFLDRWKLVQAVGPEDQIERFANRALSHVVRTNKQGVTIRTEGRRIQCP
jgi:hypothetical protein